MREKPYTLTHLIFTLTALCFESALMVIGLTWLAIHDPHMGMGVAYIFTALIALFSIGMGALQLHHYRQDQLHGEREESVS